MEKLRILIFNWRDPKNPNAGGAEKATCEIARRWVSDGHKVIWISRTFSSGQMIDHIDGITVIRIGGEYSIYTLSPLYYLMGLRRSCDVIIDEINTIPFFSIFFSRKPKVALIHQLAADVLFEELPYTPAKFWSIMEPIVLRMYRNGPFITSESTRDDLVGLGIPRRNIHTINYGVDHNLYNSEGEKSPTPLIIYLGRIRRFKGIHYLIRAMKQIVEAVPGTRAAIIGRGPQAYTTYLKRLTEDLGLAGNFDFHDFGFRDSSREKVELLRKAWVLVFPSLREGFGLTVVEANACGTPAVATDVPGLRDTVKNYETGILVPSRDVDALAKAVITLLKDEELRGRLSRNAIEWSKNFDWDRTADQILTILKGTVNP
jgi:glycosyltransferase involved in cell wall biosynthesis